MEDDKIKDLFSSKLGNFESEVPASVWGGLDQLLSNQPVQAPDASSSSSSSSSSSTTTVAGKASLLKTIVLTVGLAAAVTVGVLVLIPDKQPQIHEDKYPVVVEKVEEPKIEEEVVEDVLIIREAIAQRRSIEKEALSEEPKNIIEEKLDEEVEKKAEPIEEKVKDTREEHSVTTETFIAELPKLFTKDISLGVTTNMGLFSDDISQRGGSLLLSRNVRSKAFIDVLAKENSNYKLEHKQPVSFGLTLNKRIAPRLSVETGLLYTYLSSKLTSNSIYDIEENQTFNYLGIPLSLNYTFYELGKTKFYLSLGGMIQKDVKGKYESNINLSRPDIEGLETANNIFYLEPYYIKKTIKQSNPQFSVRTKLGIAYPLYKKLYLYGTVGGAYYFDAGNEYRTIYSDKKTQLDFNLGVKYDF
ncbi:MAG: hypothetical protein ACK5KT_09680 [Dysgonomonas sp.]